MSKSKKSTVNFVLDLERPTPLTDEQREELRALATMTEEQIDYGDISRLDDPILGKMYRPRKRQLTLRIDMDVIAWQKSKGKGYQGRINKILRQAMVKELKSRS